MLVFGAVSVYATEEPDNESTTKETTTTTKETTTTTKETTTTTKAQSESTTMSSESTKKTSKTSKTTKSTKSTKSTKASETSQSTDATSSTSAISNQNAGGTVAFKASNSKRVPVGKTTTLYLTIDGVSGSVNTEFSVSDDTVASIEKINNQSVKVTGIKEGSVVITATVSSRVAEYSLAVGSAQQTTSTAVPQGDGTTSEEPQGGESEPASSQEDWEIDLFASKENDQLQEYIEQTQQSSAGDIILGVLGFAAIFGGFGLVLSVIFRNRTPKLNLYPGSRRRFNTGGYKGKRRKRLLPDHYYRNSKKY